MTQTNVQITRLLAVLLDANTLKQTPRTGWAQRGVPNVESVAAHSYGVVLTVMLLLEVLEERVDAYRALAIAALHDLPEALTSDIPSPVKSLFPTEVRPTLKTDIERNALRRIVADTPFAKRWLALFEELHAAQTPEAKLVHDADKIDLYLQAYMYEQQTGTRRLAEFWGDEPVFHYEVSAELYRHLFAMRT